MDLPGCSRANFRAEFNLLVGAQERVLPHLRICVEDVRRLQQVDERGIGDARIPKEATKGLFADRTDRDHDVATSLREDERVPRAFGEPETSTLQDDDDLVARNCKQGK